MCVCVFSQSRSETLVELSKTHIKTHMQGILGFSVFQRGTPPPSVCVRPRHATPSNSPVAGSYHFPPWASSRLRVVVSWRDGLLVGRFENLETAHQGFVHTHHSASVVKLSAIIGSGEDGDESSIAEKLVSILDDLMRTADEV